VPVDTFKLAEIVAPFLAGWRLNHCVSPEDRGAVFSNDGTRARFCMRKEWRDESRLRITGNHSRHSITVSSTRAPSAIAADIIRRFLPIYLADVNEHDAYERERASKAVALQHKVAIFENVLGPLRAGHSRSDENYFDGGTLRFDYDDAITIGFKLSFDNAVKVAYFVKSLGDTDAKN